MERVLYNLHSNVCSIVLRRTSSKTRSLAEHTLLLVALCGFGVLIVSHLSFVHRLSPSKWRPSKNIPLQCLNQIQGFRPNANVTHILLSSRNETSVAYSISKGDYETFHCTNEEKEEQTCHRNDTVDSVCIESTAAHLRVPSPNDIVLSYSATEGFLFLPLETRFQHNVSTQYVIVSKQDVNCFGEPFLQLLVDRFLGVDTVTLNWLVAAHDGRGFLQNPRTRRVMDLKAHYSLWQPNSHSQGAYRHPLLFKAGVIVTSVFLFFITTTLVSFTLRETQDRMLQFTFQLQAHVRANRPLGQLIFTHVVENLVFVPIMVGMMFFLIEFYGGDKLLAYMVLSIVWVTEVFSTIAIRSIQGIQFFPKIFFLLFTLFHVYFFSCPFGFSYMAFASTACFMLHSMVFFWNRYELPAVARGLVTIDHPRMGGNGTRQAVASASDSTLAVPILPSGSHGSDSSRLLLPPRNPHMLHHFHQSHSHPSMSSLGRYSGASRPPSSTGLPFQGDDDGDGSESYMYFMNGEVVMHRERNVTGRSPSISTHGSFEHHDTAGSNGTPDSNAASSVPQRILASAPMAPALDAVPSDNGSNTAVAGASRPENTNNESSSSPPRPSQEFEDDDLDATPRIGSTSSVEIDSASNVPLFPISSFEVQQTGGSN